MGETQSTMDETKQNEGWGNQIMGKGQWETEMETEMVDSRIDVEIILAAEDERVWRGRQYEYQKRSSHAELLEDGQRDIKLVVGENVKRYREEAGLKRTKFANSLGYQGSNLKRLEEGGLNIGIEKLQQIANALNVNVISLIEDWEGVD